MYLKKIIKSLFLKINYIFYKKTYLPYFINHAFDIKRLFKDYNIKTIYDVGANKGQMALYYQKEFPHAVIYSFEPSKKTFNKLVNSTSQFSKIRPFNMALGSQVETLKIYHGADDLADSLIKTSCHRGTSEEVNVTTIDQFILDINASPELIKIDTEGYEIQVLNGAKKWLESEGTKFVIAEATFRPPGKSHPNLQHQTPFADLFAFLIKHNFEFVGIYDPSFGTFSESQKLPLDFCNALFCKIP